MAGPADETRRLVDRRTVQLAELHWALRSHASRIEVAMRWLDALEVPAHPAGIPAEAAAAPGHEQVVLPPEGPAPDSAARRLRVIVSESRQVSLEVEDRIPAPTPEAGPRYRLAS